jgi:hypothetical protein
MPPILALKLEVEAKANGELENSKLDLAGWNATGTFLVLSFLCMLQSVLRDEAAEVASIKLFATSLHEIWINGEDSPDLVSPCRFHDIQLSFLNGCSDRYPKSDEIMISSRSQRCTEDSTIRDRGRHDKAA